MDDLVDRDLAAYVIGDDNRRIWLLRATDMTVNPDFSTEDRQASIVSAPARSSVTSEDELPQSWEDTDAPLLNWVFIRLSATATMTNWLLNRAKESD